MLQGARVVALVGLLAVLGRLSVASAEAAQAVLRLQPYNPWPTWIAMVLTAGAFVAIALMDRETHHPAGLLALEGLIAAVIGFVPAIQWIQWFGINVFVTTAGFHQGGVDFIHPLGIVWLVIVARTGMRQVRRRESRG